MSDKEDNADARSKILVELEYLGLTHYEAELFLTLSLRGMTARELAQTTEIPYTKVYAVLEKLNQLNLVQRVSSSPSLFSIPEPDIVIGVLCDEVRSRIDEIEGHITNYLASVRRNVNKSDDLNMS